MKTVIAFALLIVGISAGPHPIWGKLTRTDIQNERIITGPIESAIQDLSQQIRDVGLDPLFIQEESLAYALPVPVLLNVDAVIDDLLFTGLSDIQVRNLNFGIITTRLTFDIELPRIAFSVKNAAMRAEIFGKEYNTRVSGSFAINSIRVSGNVRVSIGIISGIGIRDVNIDLRMRGIESDLNVVVANLEVSGYINNFLLVRIPDTLAAFSNEINEMLEIIVQQVAEGIL